jgi:hypothetical protein
LEEKIGLTSFFEKHLLNAQKLHLKAEHFLLKKVKSRMSSPSQTFHSRHDNNSQFPSKIRADHTEEEKIQRNSDHRQEISRSHHGTPCDLVVVEKRFEG